MADTTRSQELLKLAQGVTPGGVNSPVRAFKSVGGVPRFIKRGEGAYLIDVDDNRYLDFCASWGPLILGHADPDVVLAVNEQTKLGMTFGATTELEYQLAEFIVSRLDWVEQIRFVSSGTEAVMSAIRLARGYTGRDLILKFDGCYHGHSDHLLVAAGSGLATFGQPSSAGVPEGMTANTAVLPLDDIERLEQFMKENGNKLAAVIIEGIPANNGLLIQTKEFIERLRALTEKYGALLIFDEVITGFRLSMTGAAGLYGIIPDLVTYGKIIGGGMPVGGFGGRTEIMKRLSPEGDVYQAGTLSGNPIAMTAGLTTLKKLDQPNVYSQLSANTKTFADKLTKGVNSENFKVISAGSIFWFVMQNKIPRAADQIGSDGIDRYNKLHSSVLEQGIYIAPSGYEVGFVSTAHTPEMLDSATNKLIELIKEA